MAESLWLVRGALSCVAVFSSSLLSSNPAEAAVGRTAGLSAVSAGGEAQYSIPLFTPPGSHQLTPQLAFTYAHRRGNGLMGVGWEVSGFSFISRCNKTKAQDGVSSSPKLAVADAYCLDGARLRLVSGTYGTANSVYQTEIERFAKVQALGTAGNGPASFKVWTKDGLIYEYGNTPNSFIESVGSTTARVWALNRISDRTDNEIKWTYTEDTAQGSFRPAQIQYTTNATAGITTAPYTVQFVYESTNRPDVMYGYWLGNASVDGRINEYRRFDYIDVSYGATLVRRYQLTYDSAADAQGKTLLQSLQECATTSDCYPATTFTYASNLAGWGSGELTTGITVPSGVSPLALDINGDGLDDLAWSSSATSGSGTWFYALVSPGSATGYAATQNSGISNKNFVYAHAAEFSGDGKADILVPCATGTNWCVLQSTGSGFSAAVDTAAAATNSPFTTVADMNGDGRSDLVSAATSGVTLRLRNVSGSGFGSAITLGNVSNLPIRAVTPGPPLLRQKSYRRRIDMNGDGSDEVYVTVDSLHGGSSFDFSFSYDGTVGTRTTQQTHLGDRLIAGDFNGDGLTDVLFPATAAGGVVNVSYSRGDERTTLSSGPAVPTAFVTGSTLVADYDQDGLADILVAAGTSPTWWYARSTGNGFAAFVNTTRPAANAALAFIHQIDADGRSDIGRVETTGAVKSRAHATGYADYLSTVTDGFGLQTTFGYKALVDTSSSGCHIRDAAALYPIQGKGATGRSLDPYLACTLTASNGIGGTYTQTYKYYNGGYDTQGRGFLGFSKREMTDSRNGVFTVETYSQDPVQWERIGALTQQTVKQSASGAVMRETTHTWNKITYSSGTSERRFPYISQQVRKRYEAGGAYNGVLVSTATTVNSPEMTSGLIYDSTTTTVEASTANGVQAAASYVQRVYHPLPNLVNDVANWCLGKPAQTQLIQSHTQTQGTSITRTVNRGWDTVNCRPTQEVLEPSSTSWKVTTEYHYDDEAGETDADFGNLTRIVVTGIGMAARTTRVSYGATGRFPFSTTNAQSETTTLGWNPERATQASQTDPNGLPTTWQYDNFGRRTREDRPDGTATTWLYQDCTAVSGGCLNGNNKMTLTERLLGTTDGVVTDRLVYLDKRDRPISLWNRSLGGAYHRVNREYDALGRLDRQSAPCWATTCTLYWTDLTYDLLDRPTQQSRPTSDSNSTLQTTTTYYEGLTTRTVDPQGKQSTRIANVMNGVERTADHDGYYQSFDYDAFGNLKTVTDSASVLWQSYAYNVRGMVTQRVDADLGTWTFTPDALGQLAAQTDAKGATTTFLYDKLGRLTSRTEPEGVSTFAFGTSATAFNIGRLASMSGPGYSEGYSYDSAGRLSVRTVTSDATYTINYAYNIQGSLDALTYPTSTPGYRLKLQYDYQNGGLLRIKDGNAPATVFWTANGIDVRGNVIDEALGNGLRTIRGFDAVTGLVDFITTGPGGGSAIQNLSYSWDGVGNLTKRQDLNQGLTEDFIYDNQHRLDYSQRNGLQNLNLGYSANGNISAKADEGAPVYTYTYHATKKHAVISTSNGGSYGYDANGNMTSRNGSSISWYSYNLPNTLNAGTSSSQFFYGPQRSRYKQVASYAGTTETTLYVAGLLEKVTRGGVTEYKHLITTGADTSVVYVRRSSGNLESTLYVSKDHLGSTSAVTVGSGALSVQMNFGALGQRRSAAWNGSPSSADWNQITGTTRHGFTGHEHLDNLSLLHMNGRVFDPYIGRFISSDPFIDGDLETQGYNRYSYVRGRPLSFVDPSGYALCGTSGETIGPDGMNETFGTIDTGCLDFFNRWMFQQIQNAFDFSTVRIGALFSAGAETQGNQQAPCNEALVAAGNALVDPTNKLADVGLAIGTAGAVTAAGGALARNPTAVATGIGMADTGATAGFLASGLQVMAGVLQSAGGAENNNVRNALLTVGTGAMISRAIRGPSATGPESFNQRVTRAYFDRVAANAGYVYDLATNFIESLGPQKAQCTAPTN